MQRWAGLSIARLGKFDPSASRTFTLGLGATAVAIGLSNLFVPTSEQAQSVAAIAGRAFVDVLYAFDRNPPLIRAHAALGALFLLLAPLLFWRRFRSRHWKAHRVLGRLALACMVVLPVTGLASAIPYPSAAVAGVFPNLVWLAAILGCVTMAGLCVATKDILGHEAWVTRATAMTAGITLLRICDPILVDGFGMDPHRAATLVFWLGQGDGLAMAETWLRRRRGTLARRTALLAAMRR